jgi:hypothetical protein
MRTHAERVLIAGLASLNADLARYVLKVLEADHTGTHWPHTAHDEAAIALRMAELAGQINIHANLLRDAEDADAGSPRIVVGDCGPAIQIDRPTES